MSREELRKRIAALPNDRIKKILVMFYEWIEYVYSVIPDVDE